MTNLALMLGLVVDAVLAVHIWRSMTGRRYRGPERRRGATTRRPGTMVILAAAGTVTLPLLIALDTSRPRSGVTGGLGLLQWTITLAVVIVGGGVAAIRYWGRRNEGEPTPQAPAAPEAPPPTDWRQPFVVLSILAVVGGTTAIVAARTASLTLMVYWTAGAAVVAASLIAFLVGRRFSHLPVSPGRVLCIVPVYNEPAESLARTVRALMRQTVPVDVIVIDDGSRTPVVPTMAHERLRWWRQPNTGKRGAQVAVLRQIPRDTYDFILTVDSDSEPYPDACEHLLRAMSNPRVQAATGMLYIRNFRESFVSMAADIDIGSSCVMMRASRSMLGALETTSGALALYRSELFYDHLDAYAVECGTGDDRWLALRALGRGEVVAVAEARVATDMPTSVAGTYRQRLRWARSWWWMLPYVFRNLGVRQILSPVYGLMQLIVAPVVVGYSMATLFGITPIATDTGAERLLVLYVGAYLAIRYGLAALYLMGRPNVSRREKVALLLVGTPLAILLNFFLLTPTRYIALTKLFDNRWQTRQVDPNRTGMLGAHVHPGGVTS